MPALPRTLVLSMLLVPSLQESALARSDPWGIVTMESTSSARIYGSVELVGGDPGSPEPGSDGVLARPLSRGGVLRPGEVLWTGKTGRVRLLVHGHTLLSVAPLTLVAFPGRMAADRDLVDVVSLHSGEVRSVTDPRYLDRTSAFGITAADQTFITRGGPLHIKRPGSP